MLRAVAWAEEAAVGSWTPGLRRLRGVGDSRVLCQDTAGDACQSLGTSSIGDTELQKLGFPRVHKLSWERNLA